MVKEEKETADVQIRISMKTLEAIEKHGTYSDKNPEGILKRVLPEYEVLKKTCPIAKKPEKEPSELEKKPEKTATKEVVEAEVKKEKKPEATTENHPEVEEKTEEKPIIE